MDKDLKIIKISPTDIMPDVTKITFVTDKLDKATKPTLPNKKGHMVSIRV